MQRILVACSVLVLFWGCTKDGATGPAGQAGEDATTTDVRILEEAIMANLPYATIEEKIANGQTFNWVYSAGHMIRNVSASDGFLTFTISYSASDSAFIIVNLAEVRTLDIKRFSSGNWLVIRPR
ncbi:MAG: hypothetical protein ACKVRP_11940 [Bacteroidota bacterium]